jgi:O-antigen/teichoic acid export membrane protein
MARSQLVIVLLGYFGSSLDVASFRAVQPVGDLNTVVIQSFGFLFMPSMARMFARGDQKEIDDLYWQSAVWIMVLTLPIFLVTFSLAKPLTLLLYGERYAQSASVMALLALGYYFNAALGFNADTLRVYGQLRYTVTIDFLAMVISLGLCLILIPRYGAMGAAIATSGTLIVYNILNHLGLKFTTKINLFQRRYLGVYLSVTLSALGLALFQSMTSVSIYIEFFLAALLTLLVLILNWNILKAEETFPELLRFKIVRRFLPKHKSDNSV